MVTFQPTIFSSEIVLKSMQLWNIVSSEYFCNTTAAFVLKTCIFVDMILEIGLP